MKPGKRHKFQSLFLWIFRSYEKKMISQFRYNNKFQSLFLWIFRSYKNDLLDITCDGVMFQSLFLWIFRSYTISSQSKCQKRLRFNPCSYGSFVLTWLLRMQKNWFRSVSILVLMDLSFLRIVKTRWYSIKYGSFNPCSYGSFVLTKKVS